MRQFVLKFRHAELVDEVFARETFAHMVDSVGTTHGAPDRMFQRVRHVIRSAPQHSWAL